jgi:hypothetical protein
MSNDPRAAPVTKLAHCGAGLWGGMPGRTNSGYQLEGIPGWAILGTWCSEQSELAQAATSPQARSRSDGKRR